MEKTFVQELQETTALNKKKLAEQKIKDEEEKKIRIFEDVKRKLKEAASYSLDHCGVISHFGFKKKNKDEPLNVTQWHSWNDIETNKAALDLLGVPWKIEVEKCLGKKNKNYIFTLKASW